MAPSTVRPKDYWAAPLEKDALIDINLFVPEIGIDVGRAGLWVGVISRMSGLMDNLIRII